MPEKMSDPVPMPTVQALVIGTGTGDGGATTQNVTTPAGQPNVVITYITPLVALLVRFADTFLTILVTLIGAGMTTEVIPATDFMDLVTKCASLSVAGAVLGAMKDVLTLFTRLKQAFPLLNAS